MEVAPVHQRSALGLFTALLAAIAFIIPSGIFAQDAPWGLSFKKWSVEEMQPRIKPGGRANTIAVHPTNNKLILVASESGGLFRTENGGNTWTHVDTLPVFYTNAVVFAKDPAYVIVSASEDSSVASRGGIWRSDDGGKTWTQVIPTWAVTKRISAFEISIAPDTGKIYVATDHGVAASDDAQGKNWSQAPIDPFADVVNSYAWPVDRRVYSVLALPVTTQGCGTNPGGGNLILAGGRAGVRRSTDGGAHWCKPKTSMDCDPDPDGSDAGCIVDMHAFGRSTFANNQAYVASPSYKDDKTVMKIYRTLDGGDTWILSYTSETGTTGSGGIAFVKAVKTLFSETLYFSNRLTIWKRVTKIFPSGYTWSTYIKYPESSDAGDTRDLAFDNKGEPLLGATDGGVIKPPDNTHLKWTFAGANDLGNQPNGFNALQIYEVQGQWIANSRHDLYFGTQDNSVWASATASTSNYWTRCCNEGGYFEGEYHVPAEVDSQITFSFGFDPKDGNQRMLGLLFPSSEEGWTGIESWPAPPGLKVGWPKIIWKNFHVQGIEASATEVLGVKIKLKRGLAYSLDLGKTWNQYAVIDEDRVGLLRLSIPEKGPEKGLPVLYQVIRVDIDPGPKKIEVDALARIVKKAAAADASVTYPVMKNFGWFGWTDTMHREYRALAVDPKDANHLIAADVKAGKVMESENGGDDWTEISQLTNLVRDGGKLNFTGGVFFNGVYRSHESAQASAISFYNDDPNKVAVGTVQSGIFISTDRGKSWKKVPASEKVTLISSLHWRKADELIVSTYGRGLWRVRFVYSIPLVNPCKTPDCFHIYVKRPPDEQPSPYDQVAIAYGGAIKGARVVSGVLQEVFVQPGTTLAFADDSQVVPEVTVTETTRAVGFLGLGDVPAPPRNAPVITALTLRKTRRGAELVGIAFARQPTAMYVPDPRRPVQERPVGRTESPTAGKPYLELTTGSVASPHENIQVAGRNLGAGRAVEIAIDGRTVMRMIADRSGRAEGVLKAPGQFGFYAVTLVDSSSKRVLNGAILSVRPEDPRPPSR